MAVGPHDLRREVALRLVVLADRLYDGNLPLFASGESLDQLCAPELLGGGYRKKYSPRTDTPQAQRPAPGASR